jgi:cytidine deaminase
MKEVKIVTTYTEYNSEQELSQEDQTLVLRSKESVKDAYAPYSKFHVGAAVLLENGQIITGTNQENAAYPSGLCAERVAIFYANSIYPNIPVKAIAVTAFTGGDYTQKPVPPCGSCRQVISETETRFDKPIKIILAGKSKIILIENSKVLLPLQFDDGFLI